MQPVTSRRFPLTLAQQDIYFDQLKRGDSPLYNVGGYVQFGVIDVSRLQAAHTAVVASNAAFGLRVERTTHNVQQHVVAARTLSLPLLDVSADPDPDRAADMVLAEAFARPFDLEGEELFRAFLIKTGLQRYRYAGLTHHVIMDGWGFSNWAAQLSRRYAGEAAAVTSEEDLEQLARSDAEYVDSIEHERDRAYWLAQEVHQVDRLLVPHYRASFKDPGDLRSRRISVSLAKSEVAALAALAQSRLTSTPSVLLGAAAISFAATYAKRELLVGLAVHNRRNRRQKEMLGAFAGIRPMRIATPEDETFTGVVATVTRRQKELLRHARFPWSHLAGELPRDAATTRPFDIRFNYLIVDREPYFGQHESLLHYLSHHREPTPMTVTAWAQPRQQGLTLQLEYNLAYFTDEEAELALLRLRHVLAQVIANPTLSLSRIDVLPAAERERIIRGAIRPHARDPRCLHQYFEARSAATPDRVAVSDRAGRLTYRALNDRANVVADTLIARGVRPESTVGVCLQRSPDLLAAVLGILKAGAAYVPLDPEYPHERIRWMIEDSGVVATLVDSTTEARVAPVLALRIDTILAEDIARRQRSSHPVVADLSPRNLAYVIYTSGSTGRPKGVEICHENAAALIEWAASAFEPAALARVLASTSLNFDLSVFELFVPISLGHECVIARDVLELLEVPHSVTLINTVPSAIRVLLAEGAIPPATQVINLAGERLTRDLLDDLLAHHPDARVFNLYGPTETTTYSSAAVFDHPGTATPSIGQAIDGTALYVLTERMSASPIGVPGELHIAGSGVARGYRNRPALTAERFVPNPYGGEGDRLYRTGDLVRWLPGGELDFLGRIDSQIKIRGVRIEPGEIEDTLRSCQLVRASVVTAVSAATGESVLTAYVVPVDSAAEMPDHHVRAEIRSYLKAHLPGQMIPASVVLLAQLPLNVNGKIDYQALPPPEPGDAVPDCIAPATALERQLATMWSELLAIPESALGVTMDFFDIGGHSLLAVRLVSEVRSRMGRELPLRAVFEHSTIRTLAAVLERTGIGSAPGPVRRDGGHELPMSSAQQRMWFIDRMQGGSPEYNMSAGWLLEGDCEPRHIEETFRRIVARHEILRTAFREGALGPVQEIRSSADFRLRLHDLRRCPPAQQAARVRELADQWRSAPFDLERDLPLRAVLIDTSDAHQRRSVLIVILHHIVCDGWGVRVLAEEFARQYRAIVSGDANPMPSLPVQYGDYTLWQRRWLDGNEAASQLSYWQAQLAGLSAVHALPLDYSRPATKQQAADVVVRRISRPLARRLARVADAARATPFMVLHAALALVLSRHGNSPDVVVGTPFANRRHSMLDRLIGLFTNLIPLRVSTAHESLAEYLAHVREVHLQAHTNQDLPFERLVERMGAMRTARHAPLFQILFTMDARMRPLLQLSGVVCTAIEDAPPGSKYDLEVDAQCDHTGVTLSWTYDRSLFDRRRIETMSAHLECLLDAIANGTDVPLAKLSMISASERRQLLLAVNATRWDYPDQRTLPELVSEQAARTPDACAVVAERPVSYRELDSRANQLARHLIDRGLSAGAVVGLYCERSFEMVLAILGVLKAGAAYLPLDVHDPATRLRTIVAGSRMRLMMTQSGLDGCFADDGIDTVALDQVHDLLSGYSADPIATRTHGPNDLAYVIYTSGSTGRPKGVEVEHRALANRIDWMQREYGLTAEDRVLQKTPYTFDVSIWEFLWPLSQGATLVVARPEGHKDPTYLSAVLREQRVTVLHFVPSMLDEFLRVGEFADTVRYVFCSGEALTLETARRMARVAPHVQLHNLYGPTEATIDVSRFPCAELGSRRTVPIGKPIQNTQFFVVDSELELVPQGCEGELLVGGIGLARGYLGRPDLTADRFVPDPFGGAPGTRLYRTGDIVRWGPDGNFEYVDRIDGQVKIRGYRIELGEIEACVAACAGVAGCALDVYEPEPGNKYLVAYVVEADGNVAAEYADRAASLKMQLRATLPEHMVPPYFMFLPALPLMANGKVDRRALPRPSRDSPAGREYVAPRTAREAALCRAWAQVLKRKRVGIHDNFFELGGHSLLAMRLVNALRAVVGVDVPLRLLFERPTVAAFAAAATGGAMTDPVPPIVPHAGESAPLSYSQHRLWYLDQTVGASTPYNVTGGVRLEGELDVDAFRHAVETVVARHAVLRSRVVDGAPDPEDVCDLPAHVPWMQHDLSGRPDGEQEEFVAALLDAENAHRIDLRRDVRLRVHLVRLGPRAHVVVVNAHHIAADAWSIERLRAEMATLYTAFVTGHDDPLPPLAVQYGDYSRWQREWLQGPAFGRQLAYWREHLRDMPLMHALPLDFPRPPTPPVRGAHLTERFSAATLQAIDEWGQAREATRFMVLQMAFAILLSRYSHEPDVVMGMPVAGRMPAEVEPLFGCFVNTLVLRTRINIHATVDETLAQTRQQILDAYSNQHVPFDRLVQEIQPVHVVTHNPLVQVLFNLHAPRDPVAIPGLTVHDLPDAPPPVRFDLEVTATPEAAGGLRLRWAYNPAVFRRETIAALAASYRRLIEVVMTASRQRVSALPLIEPSRCASLVAAGDGDPVAPIAEHLATLFEQQAARHPREIALEADGEALSYAEMNARADQLAHRLAQHGIGPGTLVGVCAERSPRLFVALLGVLKAGAAYVPVEPATPAGRIGALVADCGAKVWLTETPLLQRFASLHRRLILLDDPETDSEPYHPIAPRLDRPGADLACVIYTSGSTGQPKGVRISHSNVCALLGWANSAFTVEERRRLLCSTSVCFDLFAFETWSAWACGATVVSVAHLAELPTVAPAPTLVNTVPSALTMLLDDGYDFAGVHTLNLAGEAVPAQLLARVFAETHVAVVNNLYGPSETTTYSTWARLSTVPNGPIPIGRPISGTRLYVLDEDGQLVPPGAVGELHIAGAGVSQGYLGKPAMTADRFRPDPYAPGRMYRTGDLVRWLPDGQLTFLGRTDAQVKLRGYRIELGEIEAQMREHAGVAQAAVAVREIGGRAALVAYAVVDTAVVEWAAPLAAALKRQLPEYMLPTAYVALPALPMTTSGKIDRRALPPPPEASASRPYVAPRTAHEAALCRLCEEVLDRRPVGIHDNFFELGGHSLLAMRFAARLRNELGLDLTLRQLLYHQTVAELAPLTQRVRSDTVARETL
nr:non-ribosomal peptide synthetase [uncultured bacterium]